LLLLRGVHERPSMYLACKCAIIGILLYLHLASRIYL